MIATDNDNKGGKSALGRKLLARRFPLPGVVAVAAIGEVVGKTTTEDILDSIFSQFCIGK